LWLSAVTSHKHAKPGQIVVFETLIIVVLKRSASLSHSYLNDSKRTIKITRQLD